MNKIKQIIILGMHKSGTSMVAGILNKLGISMGDKLLEKDFTNPLGYYEDLKLLNLNCEILSNAGGNWEKPPSRSEILETKVTFDKKIKKFIESKNNNSIWGIKDPRTSLTVELFLPHLQNPYFIICKRNPKHIAASLKRRNTFNEDKSIELTKYYYKRIEKFKKRHIHFTYLVADYEKITAEPKVFIEKLKDFLKIEVSDYSFNEAVNFVLTNKKMHLKGLSIRIMREKKLDMKIKILLIYILKEYFPWILKKIEKITNKKYNY